MTGGALSPPYDVLRADFYKMREAGITRCASTPRFRRNRDAAAEAGPFPGAGHSGGRAAATRR